jgi:hypothetical protein
LTATSNIGSLRSLSTGSRGHIALELGSEGCFNFERDELRLSWDDQRGMLERRAGRHPARSVELSLEEVRRFVEQLADALLRPEVPQGGRTTNRYFGAARWEAITDHGPEAGDAHWETRDLPPEVVADVVAERPELARRIPASTYAVAFGVQAVVTQLEEVVRSRDHANQDPRGGER